MKAIIFDADGVVVDSEAIWDRAQTEFLRCRGIVYCREETKHLLTGRSPLEAIKIMQQIYHFSGDPETLSTERVGIVKKMYQQGVGLVPGFIDFFQLVKRRYLTALATSMDQELMKVVDLQLDLSALFGGCIFTVADVAGVGKPDPAIFLLVAERLAVSPKQCLVIEDAPNGIRAAKDAGMKCAALTTTHSVHLLKDADYIGASFDDVAKYLNIPRP